MKSYRLFLGVAVGAVALNSCTQEDPAPVDTKPYYQFTADNKAWFSAKEGEEWIFETVAGKRQQYRVVQLDELIKATGNGPLVGGGGGTYYYDQHTVQLRRLDTLAGGSIVFTRTIPAGADAQHPPAGPGAFYAGGWLDTYIGDLSFGNIFPITDRSLNFPVGLSMSALTVGGRVYSRVVVLSSNRAPGLNPLSWGVPKRYIQRIYYDQQYGIVRMESVTGEVWDRVR